MKDAFLKLEKTAGKMGAKSKVTVLPSENVLKIWHISLVRLIQSG